GEERRVGFASADIRELNCVLRLAGPATLYEDEPLKSLREPVIRHPCIGRTFPGRVGSELYGLTPMSYRHAIYDVVREFFLRNLWNSHLCQVLWIDLGQIGFLADLLR